MTNPEIKRLKIVRQINKFDFHNYKELNDIVALANEVFSLPIAMVNLITKDKVLVKVKTGDVSDVNNRDQSFCKYLVDSNQVLVVTDALKDERFKNNPSVTGDFNLRFYAGAPLITSRGFHIGSLCIVDHKAREFSVKEQGMLSALSRQVMSLIEMKIHLSLLKEQKEKTDLSARKLRAIFNSSASCHILIGKDLKILDYNKITASFIKEVENRQIKKGLNILNFIGPAFKIEFLTNFKRALAGKRTNSDVLINHRKTIFIWWNITFFPVKDEHGDIISVCYKCSNINEKKMQSDAIYSKNELLTNIAYIQSHEYRKPVASILGLMNIIKQENYISDKECLLMMESAVNELDAKIKSVVGFTETTVSGFIPEESLVSA